MARRIVLLPPNWIGDAVMAQPAMRAIVRHHEGADIDVYGRSWLKELLPWLDLGPARYSEQLGGHDTAWLFPNSFRAAWLCRRAGIRTIIGYRGQWRSLLLSRGIRRRLSMKHDHHRLGYLDLVRQCGIPADDAHVRLKLPPEAQAAGRSLLRDHGLDPERTICLAPGAQFGGAKRYPAASYGEVARDLANDGWQIAILGLEADRDFGAIILQQADGSHWNAAGQTTLTQALQLIAACRLMLCNDSGFMHVAAGLGIPTVAPFGATDPARTSPDGPRVRILYQPAPCSPCLERECKVAGQPCMANIPPGMMIEACRNFLEHA